MDNLSQDKGSYRSSRGTVPSGSQINQEMVESLNTLKENATQYLRKGKETAQNLEQNLETRIHQHPMMSVLVAGVAGVCLGALIRMKREML